MFSFQILVIAILLVLFYLLLRKVFEEFGVKGKYYIYLWIPLAFFSFGFVLRLTSQKWLVDLGYFLTDFSSLFVSVLFTLFLFLGQLKYWKKQ